MEEQSILGLLDKTHWSNFLQKFHLAIELSSGLSHSR